MYVSNVMLWYGMVCTVYIYYSNIHYIYIYVWIGGMMVGLGLGHPKIV